MRPLVASQVSSENPTVTTPNKTATVGGLLRGEKSGVFQFVTNHGSQGVYK